MLFFENFNFFYFYLNSEGSLIFFHWQTLITNRKYQRAQQITKICIKFWHFAQGYLPKNDTFCHISLDFTLFHQFLAVSVPNIVNIGHFTLIKVRRNSGELKNMPFLVGQSYHLRIAKTQGSSGWNYSAPPMTHREAQNAPKTFNKDKIHQHKAFWSTLEPFIRPWESQNDHFHRPGTWLSTQLDFHLRSLLISECGFMKKLKWGSVDLFFTNSLYLVVHLDGYVQRIFKIMDFLAN